MKVQIVKVISPRSWYRNMIGDVIEVTYDDINDVYEIDNAEKRYPQEFDDGVVGLYLSPDDVQVL